MTETKTRMAAAMNAKSIVQGKLLQETEASISFSRRARSARHLVLRKPSEVHPLLSESSVDGIDLGGDSEEKLMIGLVSELRKYGSLKNSACRNSWHVVPNSARLPWLPASKCTSLLSNHVVFLSFLGTKENPCYCSCRQH